MKYVSNREHWIDCVRGFAILCIMTGHIDQSADNPYIVWIYSFEVTVFFVLSGILLGMKEKWKELSFIEFAKKKIITYIYPYLTFNVLGLISFFFTNGMDVKVTISRSIQALSLCGVDAMWFLPTLCFGELLFFVVYKSEFKKALSIPIIAVAVLLSYIHTTFRPPFGSGGIKEWFYRILCAFDRALFACIFLAIGYILFKYLFKYLDSIKNVHKYVLMLVFFAVNIVISQVNGWVDFRNVNFNNQILFALETITGSLAVIMLMKYVLKKSKVLEFLGKNSLIIMCTHMSLPLLSLSKVITQLIPFVNEYRHISNLVCLIILTIIEVIVVLFINKFLKFLIVLPKKQNKINSN